jgi:hypothetical protein
MRQPEGSFGGPDATVSHLVPALLPISREARAPLTHLDDGRSRHPSLVNLLTVADHEQVRNLPTPGEWPRRRDCVPDWSRKRDRPVVSARRNDRDCTRGRGDHRSGVSPDRRSPFVLPSPFLIDPGVDPRMKLND